jgi:hypothetical protein
MHIPKELDVSLFGVLKRREQCALTFEKDHDPCSGFAADSNVDDGSWIIS